MARRTSSVTAGQAAADHAVDLVGPTGDPEVSAAFFDVDGTLLQGASLFHLARGLYGRGFFEARELRRFAWRQVQFRARGVEDPDALREARETALEFIRGRRVDELTRLTEEVFEAVLQDKVWPGTRALARRHVEAGQRVFLVTATPVEVAATIARMLGLTGALGTVAESVDGVFTGRLVGEVLHGTAKAEAVRVLAAREGLDLRSCAAYSDSSNDLPLLELVGHPCAINPDRRLRKLAQARHWRQRDYRSVRRAWRMGIAVVAVVGGVGTLATRLVLARLELRSRGVLQTAEAATGLARHRS